MEDDLTKVYDDYVAMATTAKVTDAQRQTYSRVGRELSERGAEAVLLARY